MSAFRTMSCRCGLLFVAGWLAPMWVSAACEQPVGGFVSITGSVDIQVSGADDWVPAKRDSRLCEGDTIRVGERSRAAVSLINDAVLRIDQNTAMRLIDVVPEEKETSLLDLFTGAIQSFSRKPKFLRVNTPYLNGSVEGTEFAARVDDGTASFTVFEGVVVAANAAGQVALQPGESASASQGQAPQRRTVVRPRDLVQWALYYPPVLAMAPPAAESPALSKAANCAANGNMACAFAALDNVPSSQRDAHYTLMHASLLLAVGRVDEARAEIDAALKADQQASAAHALRAVIGVAQNKTADALADGRRAVELDPGSASAKIALSYALQADLDLAGARDTLLQAVEQQPDNALAWARLAELQLAMGDRRAATAAAEKAVELQPGLSRTHNVLGFSALAEINVAQAQAAFEQAIALDSADPLPHLGLGLALIRQGMLAEGRQQIEAAVALDSNNALLRAYLGKAYFEEKRGPLDGQQFRIAKELDPLDPTAYFYNAIRLLAENRPVDALRDLEASIARNDNRAVYRSRLQLDQDRAARGTSQARVYATLGFAEMALAESRRSVNQSPSNAAAHRFVSDSYQNVRRREISRVSELLQAQMLQDVNTNPVQPSVAETNLNALNDGPARAGFNEFTPLFERNRASGSIAVFGGNHDTVGGEAVVSGVVDRLSLSAGAYHYESDGWRENNALDQDIYDFFVQAAVTPQLNLQLELRHRESEEGDLAFNFDPDDFLSDKTVEREQDTARIGVRYSPTVSTTLLFSYIHNERDERLVQSEALAFPFVQADLDVDRNDKGHQVEAQYILEQPSYNLVAGVGYNEVDVEEDRSLFLYHMLNLLPPPPLPPGFPPPPPVPNPIDASAMSESEIEHKRAYLYSNFDLADGVTATVGLAYDDYDEDSLDESWVSPKAGIQWQLNESLRLRAAALQTVKPPVVNNRTIEPTQVAGFNQFFDDINATESTLYGLGLDWGVAETVSVGAELTWRDLEEPVFVDMVGWHFEDRDEQLHRAWLYWTPDPSWAVSAAIEYDRYEADLSVATAEANVPEDVETISLPLGVRYFAPSGLFAGVTGTYVDQEVQRGTGATQASGSDSFFLVDLAVGYRLPKRRGVVSLAVKNVFDEDFSYQDDSYREFRDEPATGPYFPETTIMGQVTINF